MAERKYVRKTVDFDALRSGIARAEPERVTVNEILEELAEPIMAAVEKGVSLTVIRDQFQAQKIQVQLRQLRDFVAGRSVGEGAAGE